MRKGRKLELLLKEIEALKLPNATVKSPEFVKDRDTGTLREVDISIRYCSNDQDFFIALECRDRGNIQDITWVEQLISKRNSIGADVLIAVTSSSFSTPAKIKAFKNGVVLREFKKFTVNEVKKWMNETYIEIHIIRKWVKAGSIELQENVTLSKPLDQYMFIFKDISHEFSFMEFISMIANRDIFLTLRDKVPERKDNIEFEVSGRLKDVYINIPPAVIIEKVNLKLVAENLFLKAPLVSGFNYSDCDGDTFIAEGYSYSLGEPDVFSSLLIDSD